MSPTVFDKEPKKQNTLKNIHNSIKLLRNSLEYLSI